MLYPAAMRRMTFALLFAWPGFAWAHAILMGGTPTPGSRVASGPLIIVLRYNSLIDVRRSRLTLVGPDQTARRLAIARAGQGDRMTARAAPAVGHNVLRWQVLAVDGHITRGDVPFDVVDAPPFTGR